jgi:hypothetical protein
MPHLLGIQPPTERRRDFHAEQARPAVWGHTVVTLWSSMALAVHRRPHGAGGDCCVARSTTQLCEQSTDGSSAAFGTGVVELERDPRSGRLGW